MVTILLLLLHVESKNARVVCMSLEFKNASDPDLPNSLECFQYEDGERVGELIGYIDEMYNTLGNIQKFIACFCMNGNPLQPDLSIYVDKQEEGKDFITEQYLAYMMTGVLERDDEEV